MVGTRTRYFVSYVKKVSSRFVGGDLVYTNETGVIDEHPVLWALKHERTLTFWSEIPEHVYQRVKAADREAKAARKEARRG